MGLDNGYSEDFSLEDTESHHSHSIKLAKDIGTDTDYVRKIVWFNALTMLMLHLYGILGFFLLLGGYAKVLTSLYTTFLIYASVEGVTIGAHRLWSHKSFKASTGLRLTLVFLQTMAGQNSIWEWVRDHRQHHKYSDTDADPHNARRGFFFSHMGWLMSKKHPKVFEYGRKIDMSDIEADPMLMFQKKYFRYLYFIISVLLPTMIPVKLWGEDPWTAFVVSYVTRTMFNYNGTWLVNSAAHLYGTKPFDKRIVAVESQIVGFVAIGEGWHNYHHTFPWDYKASELGSPFNFTRKIIDLFARCGWVWDRRVVSQEMIAARMLRTGDGTHDSLIK